MSESKVWPTDIQIKATDAAREYLEGGEDGYPLPHVIARVILAERERCAAIAANFFDLRHNSLARANAASIAYAIRRPPAS